MSQINISNLTFNYSSHHENIFDNTSFNIDTDWKLGLISRNGRGKTTFLNILLGKYSYKGNVHAQVEFDYFPFLVKNPQAHTKDVMKDAVGPYLFLEKQMDHLLEKGDEVSMERYSEVLTQYNELDGFILNELFEKELNKMSVTIDVLERPYSTLSNGEQTKVMIAALFIKIERLILEYKPTLLFVEHDQMFREKIATKVVTIEKKILI